MGFCISYLPGFVCCILALAWVMDGMSEWQTACISISIELSGKSKPSFPSCLMISLLSPILSAHHHSARYERWTLPQTARFRLRSNLRWKLARRLPSGAEPESVEGACLLSPTPQTSAGNGSRTTTPAPCAGWSWGLGCRTAPVAEIELDGRGSLHFPVCALFLFHSFSSVRVRKQLIHHLPSSSSDALESGLVPAYGEELWQAYAQRKSLVVWHNAPPAKELPSSPASSPAPSRPPPADPRSTRSSPRQQKH